MNDSFSGVEDLLVLGLLFGSPLFFFEVDFPVIVFGIFLFILIELIFEGA